MKKRIKVVVLVVLALAAFGALFVYSAYAVYAKLEAKAAAAVACAKFYARAEIIGGQIYCTRLIEGTEYLIPLEKLDLAKGSAG